MDGHLVPVTKVSVLERVDCISSSKNLIRNLLSLNCSFEAKRLGGKV